MDAAVDGGELGRLHLALPRQLLLDGLLALVEGALEQLQDLALEALVAALEVLVQLPERVLALLRHPALLPPQLLLQRQQELLHLRFAHHEVAAEAGGGGRLRVVPPGGVVLGLRGRQGVLGLGVVGLVVLVELLVDVGLAGWVYEAAVLVGRGVVLVLGEQVVQV